MNKYKIIIIFLVTTLCIFFIVKVFIKKSKKDGYEILKFLQQGIEDSPKYKSLGNKLGYYFMKDHITINNTDKWDTVWCGNFMNYVVGSKYTEKNIEAYINCVNNSLPLIKQKILKIAHNKSVQNDAVVHIRCSDVPFNRHPNYHLQPKEYYQWVAHKFKKENIKAIHFVLCSNHLQKNNYQKNKCDEFATVIRDWMREFMPNVEIKPIVCLSVLESFKMFLGCKILVQGGASPSSFSFFPGLTKGKKFLTPKFINEDQKNKSTLINKFIDKFPWSMWHGNPIWHSLVKNYKTL
jgi:hypothetical protein